MRVRLISDIDKQHIVAIVDKQGNMFCYFRSPDLSQASVVRSQLVSEIKQGFKPFYHQHRLIKKWKSKVTQKMCYQLAP